MVPAPQQWSNSHNLNESSQEQLHHTPGAGGRRKKTGTQVKLNLLSKLQAFYQNVYISFSKNTTKRQMQQLNMSLAQMHFMDSDMPTT